MRVYTNMNAYHTYRYGIHIRVIIRDEREQFVSTKRGSRLDRYGIVRVYEKRQQAATTWPWRGRRTLSRLSLLFACPPLLCLPACLLALYLARLPYTGGRVVEPGRLAACLAAIIPLTRRDKRHHTLPKIFISSPFSNAAFTYAFPLLRVKAISCTAVLPASRI